MTSEASADISRLTEALRATAAESQTTTFNVLVSSANYIRNEMLALVPVRTGVLRNSIHITVDSDRVTIGPNLQQAPYGGYVEFGTKPHVIRAKRGKALKFKMGGTTVIVTKVNHPGTRPHPYVMPAFTHWVDSLGTMAAEANVRTFRDNAH